MSLLFQVLASGSKGNSVLVCSAKTRILIDAGTTCKELSRRLGKTAVEAKQLDAIVISHEHSDHVTAAGVLSRKFNLPVYMSRGTVDNLPPDIGQLSSVKIFSSGRCFDLGDLRIHPFATSHDAREPAGFIIEHEGSRLGICTDLGIVTNLVKVRLQGCHGLVLEANHDVKKLMDGPYPPFLKQRIKSSHGHLSNEEACHLLDAIHHDKMRCVVFAHLSETNNHPDLVAESYRKLRNSPKWEGVRFELGKQEDIASAFELNGK
ncbi:MAG: MBL fold metallo-hydrolase [Syntrophobacteraceae bacterium]